MEYVVRSINVFSVARVSFCYFTLFGVVLDVLYLSFFGLLPASPEAAMLPIDAGTMSVGGTLFYMLMFAITFGAFMALFMAVGTLIYNGSSAVLGGRGGIKLHLETLNPLDTRPVTQLKRESADAGRIMVDSRDETEPEEKSI